MSKKQSKVDSRMSQFNPPAIRTRLQAIVAAGEDIPTEQVVTTIGGASLSQNAAVLARLGVTWYDDAGLPNNIPMGPYLPVNSYVHYNLGAEGVPEGSIVKFYLDIDAAGDEINEQLFVYSAAGTLEAHLAATGTLGSVNFYLESLDPIGKKKKPKK